MIFVTGTNTNIGKTCIATWLCMHTGMDYWKPIQTGIADGETDSEFVARHADVHIHEEAYRFLAPLSPEEAGRREGVSISLEAMVVPKKNTIIEGAGGVLVPVGAGKTMVDVMMLCGAPVLIVASTQLGTINHTLLTVHALCTANISIAGIVLNGMPSTDTKRAIQEYSGIPVLAEFPEVRCISKELLRSIPLPRALESVIFDTVNI